MNRLIAVLVAAAFAVGPAAALAQGTTTPAPKTDAMKSSSDMSKSKDAMDKDKYKECMKKDAAGKESMDQACKDKIDKAGMAKSSDSMSKSKDTTKK